jgi:hypothetical protein
MVVILVIVIGNTSKNFAMLSYTFVMFSRAMHRSASDRAFGSSVVRFVYVIVVPGTQRTLLSPCHLVLWHCTITKAYAFHDL